jgi:hypothetical protein
MHGGEDRIGSWCTEVFQGGGRPLARGDGAGGGETRRGVLLVHSLQRWQLVYCGFPRGRKTPGRGVYGPGSLEPYHMLLHTYLYHICHTSHLMPVQVCSVFHGHLTLTNVGVDPDNVDSHPDKAGSDPEHPSKDSLEDPDQGR